MSKLVQPSIIIIGAGAAGISAATKLITNGFTNVTILEAENRIGGRVHSVPFGGTIVDLGAQWVDQPNLSKTQLKQKINSDTWRRRKRGLRDGKKHRAGSIPSKRHLPLFELFEQHW